MNRQNISSTSSIFSLSHFFFTDFLNFFKYSLSFPNLQEYFLHPFQSPCLSFWPQSPNTKKMFSLFFITFLISITFRSPIHSLICRWRERKIKKNEFSSPSRFLIEFPLILLDFILFLFLSRLFYLLSFCMILFVFRLFLFPCLSLLFMSLSSSSSPLNR